MVNGVPVSEPILQIADLIKFGSWAVKDPTLSVELPQGVTCSPSCTVDLLVENLGRVNFGSPHDFDQKKGLWEGDILLDGEIVDGWEHVPLEMRSEWVSSLSGWTRNPGGALDYGPKMLKGSLDIADGGQVADTFFDFDCGPGCDSWLHGVVWVNGFNVGRYWQVGPQKGLYVPGALLRAGRNEIVVFESYCGESSFAFTDQPNYGPAVTP